MLTEDQKLRIRKIRFVRRIYKKYPVLAILFIRERYPDYTENQLISDLIIKRRPKKKAKKRKQVRDFRRVQMERYADRLKSFDPQSKEYHQACNMIVILENAHKLKGDIKLDVNIKGEKMTYHFPWHVTERLIKDFKALANKPGITHTELAKAQRPSFTGN